MKRTFFQALAAWALVALALVPTMATAEEVMTKDSKAADLPDLESVLARHVEAMGGEKAIRAHSSRVSKGTFQMVEMGMNGAMTLTQSAPDMLLQEVEIEGFGTERAGYNGSVAWQLSNMSGPMVLDGAAKAEMVRQGDFYFELNIKNHYESMEVVATTTFAEEECIQVKATSKHGKEENYYFSVASGHLVGHAGNMSTGMGEVAASTEFSDFKVAGGVKIPHQLKTKVMGQTQLITIDSINYDPVDAAAFKLPAEISVMAEGDGS